MVDSVVSVAGRLEATSRRRGTGFLYAGISEICILLFLSQPDFSVWFLYSGSFMRKTFNWTTAAVAGRPATCSLAPQKAGSAAAHCHPSGGPLVKETCLAAGRRGAMLGSCVAGP